MHNNCNTYISDISIKGVRQIMYNWLYQLIGVPSHDANYYITQGAIQIVEGVMCAVAIMVIFVVLRLVWGRRV